MDAVAAWTKVSAITVKARPTANAISATAPFDSPADSARLVRLVRWKRIAWRPLARSSTGMKTTPTATQTRNRPVYMRRVDVTIWPHARRRARRSGAEDSHCVREAAQKRSRTTAAKKAATPSGFRLIRTSSVEPIATASQKTVVAAGPNASPAGTANARSRQVVSAQVIGCVHCVLSFGPVGPL